MTALKTKIGIIGCGRIAQQVHVPILSQSPEIELTALADTDDANLRKAKRIAPRAGEYKNYRDLLAQPDIEAVVIATPTGMHAETAIAAFEHDKHVYLEKPLAASLQEAERVLSAWRESQKIGAMGFNYRFSQAYQALQKRIHIGQIGTPIAARSVFSSGDPHIPEWKAKRNSGGGVLLDMASHHVDLVRFVLQSEVRRVSALIQSVRTEADTAMLQLDLESGLSVQSFFSLNSVTEQWFEVYGSEGKLRARPYDRTDVEQTDKTRPSATAKLWQAFRTSDMAQSLLNRLREQPMQASYRASLKQFVTCVQTNRPASPDLTDGYRNVAVLEAAEESARTGQIICVRQMADTCV